MQAPSYSPVNKNALEPSISNESSISGESSISREQSISSWEFSIVAFVGVVMLFMVSFAFVSTQYGRGDSAADVRAGPSDQRDLAA